MNNIDIIIAAQQKQIKNPTRAVVNSESAFVWQTITKTDEKLGIEYWRWVTSDAMFPERGSIKFGQEVYENEILLNAIHSGVSMPEWGTYGT